jgi:glycosyltransferase involved in cell wall biosynthesis
MLLGVPCIASYVGGIPSMVTNEENGLLFSAGDPFSLAACILKVLGDKSLMNKLSKNAQQVANDRHNPVSIAQNMKDIYLELSKKGISESRYLKKTIRS